jgi:hypothetical protein
MCIATKQVAHEVQWTDRLTEESAKYAKFVILPWWGKLQSHVALQCGYAGKIR